MEDEGANSDDGTLYIKVIRGTIMSKIDISGMDSYIKIDFNK
jgi:hypothetical protein